MANLLANECSRWDTGTVNSALCGASASVFIGETSDFFSAEYLAVGLDSLVIQINRRKGILPLRCATMCAPVQSTSCYFSHVTAFVMPIRPALND